MRRQGRQLTPFWFCNEVCFTSLNCGLPALKADLTYSLTASAMSAIPVLGV
jgi:hypothetical protein